MRYLLSIYLILTITCSFSQSIEEMVSEMYSVESSESIETHKRIAYSILEKDPLNEDAISFLFRVYDMQLQKDSILFLFNNLIKSQPDNPESFLQCAYKTAHADNIQFTINEKLNYLNQAYMIDNHHPETIYELGKTYYDLFNLEYCKKGRKDRLDFYARKSIHNLIIQQREQNQYSEVSYYPLKQLGNYLNDYAVIYFSIVPDSRKNHFPLSAFVVQPRGWTQDFSVNVFKSFSLQKMELYGVSAALSEISSYSTFLRALNEPVIHNIRNKNIIRFTYLPTFDNPVSIRVEKSDEVVTLYWKKNNGMGGYEPGDITLEGSKTLSIKEWNIILSKLIQINFANLPVIKQDSFGYDGSQWLLETLIQNQYHVVSRWCGDEIASICLQLVYLADIEIELESYGIIVSDNTIL